MIYDIFISYRHRYTSDKAEHLLTLLENNGYHNRVSFDKDNLNRRFDLELIRRIDECTDFIIVLSEDTFTNLIDSDADKYKQLSTCLFEDFLILQNQLLPNPDFTRLELARAIAQGKNIIPIAPIKSERYNFDALELPSDIQPVNKFQAIFYDTNSSLTFKEVVEVKLLKSKKSLLKSTPTYRASFSWKLLAALCLFITLCIGAHFIWEDYNTYNKCSSIREYRTYLELGQGIFNNKANNKIKEIDEILQFSNSTDSARVLVKDKDYNHLTQLQAEALNEILSNMVFIEGGTFLMGAEEEQANSRKEIPRYETQVQDYYIGKFEVSRYEWNAIKGISPTNLPNDSLDTPITDISWEEVQQWIAILNDFSGLKFGLPHEQEWEYAAKGGIYEYDKIYAGSNTIEDVAWSSLDALDTPRPRQRDGVTWYRKSNELGLYNMSGNVAEMCSNDFYYYDTTKHFLGIDKVTRGGSYDSPITHCTVTYRDLLSTTATNPNIGFRLILIK